MKSELMFAHSNFHRSPCFGWHYPGEFGLPTKSKIDKNLVVGASLFGMGWGIAGFCPGPALASIATLELKIFVFVVAMICGIKLVAIFEEPV